MRLCRPRSPPQKKTKKKRRKKVEVEGVLSADQIAALASTQPLKARWEQREQICPIGKPPLPRRSYSIEALDDKSFMIFGGYGLDVSTFGSDPTKVKNADDEEEPDETISMSTFTLNGFAPHITFRDTYILTGGLCLLL